MNTKLAYFFLLGVSLVASGLVGRVLAKHKVARLWCVLCTLTGGIVFIVGQIAADTDHRFRLLALVGLSLQLVGVVGSFRNKRTLKESSVDLWAPQKH